MKKQLVLLLAALALCAGLCACGSGPKTAVRLEAPASATAENGGVALCHYRTGGDLHAITFTRYIRGDDGWELTDWNPAVFDEGDLVSNEGDIAWNDNKLWLCGAAFSLPDPENDIAITGFQIPAPLETTFDADFDVTVPLLTRRFSADGVMTVRCILGEEQPILSADAAFEELICITFHDAVPAFLRQPDSMTLAAAGPDEFESQALQDNGIYPDNAAFFRAAVDNSIRSAILRRYVMQNGGWQLDDSQIFPVSGSCTVAVGGVDNNREFLTWCASGSGVHLKTWANADASLMAQRAGPADITAGTELALVCRTSEDMHLTEDTFSSLDNIKAALSQSTDNEIVTIEFSSLDAQ